MKKTYLLTPGPTPIPEKIHAAFAEPLIHHRTEEFELLFKEIRDQLKNVFQTTKNEVLILASSGTGAMEAAITNLFSPNDTVITINSGKFGERWTQLAKAYGLNPVEILLTPGDSLDPKELEQVFLKNPNAKAVLFQASETSTGTSHPVKEICEVAKNAGALSVCDAITACGVVSLPMDEWNIDVLLSGSQKAFMIPPGLAMISLSDRAWKATETSKLPKFYFDLNREKKAHLKNQTAWTPAISLLQGLHRALQMMKEEGLTNIYKRHERLAHATQAGVKALGLEILCKKKEFSSHSVTAVRVPATLAEGKKIPKLLRDQYGVIIAGGQDELEGKIFRLSHFGYVSIFDITTALCAVELVLKDLGHPIKLGSGAAAALEVWSKK